MLKNILSLFITFLLVSASSFTFASDSSQTPLWDSKQKKISTFPIYKLLVICGGEYGYMCKKIEEPMGNIKTQKIIYLNEKSEVIEKDKWENNFFLANSISDPADDFESDIPKDKVLLEHYFKFLNSRPAVSNYKRKMKLN